MYEKQSEFVTGVTHYQDLIEERPKPIFVEFNGPTVHTATLCAIWKLVVSRLRFVMMWSIKIVQLFDYKALSTGLRHAWPLCVSKRTTCHCRTMSEQETTCHCRTMSEQETPNIDCKFMVFEKWYLITCNDLQHDAFASSQYMLKWGSCLHKIFRKLHNSYENQVVFHEKLPGNWGISQSMPRPITVSFGAKLCRPISVIICWLIVY